MAMNPLAFPIHALIRFCIPALILFLYYVPAVTAFGDGADFSNNLFSDLGPILALFGEQVTKQFIAGSTTWEEHIILAMAPLGIMTIIVAAIRIGGPTWLQGVIGRARESKAIAEMELTTSTSQDVCELWNGSTIVRSMGSPSILQLFFLEQLQERDERGLFTLSGDGALYCPSGIGDPPKTAKEASNRISVFESAVLRRTFGPWINKLFNGPQKSHAEQEQKQKSDLEAQQQKQKSDLEAQQLAAQTQGQKNHSSTRTAVESVQNPHVTKSQTTAAAQPGENSQGSLRAPNIFLNLQAPKTWKQEWELRGLAIVAVILQGAVVLFWAFAAYHPSIAYTKDENPEFENYAFPLTAGGTALLIVGILICAYIVDGCTIEEFWKLKQDIGKARVLWIQQGGNINDQHFESYAIFAKGKRDGITTSTLSPYVQLVGGSSTSESAQDSTAEGQEKSPPAPIDRNARDASLIVASKPIKVLVIIGTVMSVVGFIAQFTGLRAMHWSASIAQLIAIFLLAIIRAWIRRDLDSDPVIYPIPKGYELDWLATRLAAKEHENLWGDGKNEQLTFNKQSVWHSEGPPDSTHNIYANIPTDAQKYQSKLVFNPIKGESEDSAHQVMKIRERLGLLSGWRGRATEPACVLANTIEAIMNNLFAKRTEREALFSLPVERGDSKKSSEFEYIQFALSRKDPEQGGSWKMESSEIDALLSLWIYSAEVREPKPSELQNLGKSTKWSQDWCRRGKAEVLGLQPVMRLLGPSSGRYDKDTRWYLGSKNDQTRHVKVGASCALTNNHWTLQEITPKTRVSRFHEALSILTNGRTPTPLEEGQEQRNEPSCAGHEAEEPSDFGRNSKAADVGYGEALGRKQPGEAREPDAALAKAPAPGEAPGAVGEMEPAREAVVEDIPTTPPTQQSARKQQAQTGPEGVEEVSVHTHQQDNVSQSMIPLELLGWNSDMSLETFYAQEFLALFMWAVAEEIICLEGETIMKRTNIGSWDHPIVENSVLTRMQKEIENVWNQELGPLDYIYHIILQPLSLGSKLPRPSYLTPYARGLARDIELAGKWEQATRIYTWLLDESLDFGPSYRHTFKLQAYAAAWQFHHTLKDAEELSDDLRHKKRITHCREQLEDRLMRKKQVTTRTRSWDWQDFDHEPLQWLHAFQNSEPEDPTKIAQVSGGLFYLTEYLELPELHHLVVKCITTTKPKPDNAADKGAMAVDFDEPANRLRASGELHVQDSTGWTALHYAVWGNLPDLVETLARFGSPEIHSLNIAERTPLHYARSDIIARYLLREGAKINIQGRDGLTPLHCAVKRGHPGVVSVLLEGGADINLTDNTMRTPLHWAAYLGNEQLVTHLVKKGADLSARDCMGQLPLHLAAKNNNLTEDIFDTLQGTTYFNTLDRKRRTPLHHAVINDHIASLEVFLQIIMQRRGKDFKGLQPKGKNPEGFQLAEKDPEELQHRENDPKGAEVDIDQIFHLAVREGSIETVNFLLSTEAEGKFNISAKNLISAADINLRMPLHIASTIGHVKIVVILIEKDAKVTDKDALGATPLHLACAEGHEKVVEVLLENNANTEDATNHGQTPLELATTGKHPAIVALLKAHAAKKPVDTDTGKPTTDKDFELLLRASSLGETDIVIELLKSPTAKNLLGHHGKDFNGATPLHLASMEGNTEVVQVLLGQGANPDAKDDSGAVPLHLASARGHEAVVEVLLASSQLVFPKDNKGETPISLAIRNNHLGVVQLLFNQARVNNNIPKQDMGILLRVAVQSKNINTVRVLLSCGAEIETQDEQGRRPLHLAAAGGNEEVVRCLMERGADVLATNKRGDTAAMYAVRQGNEKVARLLGARDMQHKVKTEDVIIALSRISNTRPEVIKEFTKVVSSTIGILRHLEQLDLRVRDMPPEKLAQYRRNKVEMYTEMCNKIFHQLDQRCQELVDQHRGDPQRVYKMVYLMKNAFQRFFDERVGNLTDQDENAGEDEDFLGGTGGYDPWMVSSLVGASVSEVGRML